VGNGISRLTASDDRAHALGDEPDDEDDADDHADNELGHGPIVAARRRGDAPSVQQANAVPLQDVQVLRLRRCHAVTRSLLGWPQQRAFEHLASLLDADGLVVPEREVLQSALQLYRDQSRLDFADAYLAACGLTLGPPLVASFDRDLDAVQGLRRIRETANPVHGW
jgi:predicted nucleic acid-binding protein